MHDAGDLRNAHVLSMFFKVTAYCPHFFKAADENIR